MDVWVVLGLATLIVGCYGFAWMCSNHAMAGVKELTKAFNDLQVEIAARLARIEERLGIDSAEKRKK